MRLSNELQRGKAGEHIAAADLILQGYNAFLSDQGLNYDIVVDMDGRLLRVQVKTTIGPVTLMYRGDRNGKKIEFNRHLYRFGMRRAKNGSQSFPFGLVDIFAFVVLDTRQVAYIKAEDLRSKDGSSIVMTIEFACSDKTDVKGLAVRGRRIKDYAIFPI